MTAQEFAVSVCRY